METAIATQERIAEPKVSSSDVWKEFERYEGKAQKGFDTQEEKLGSYTKFIQNLASYLRDPSIKNSAEARDLVRKLFYQHDQVAAIPIGFFHDAAERLKDEVLEGGYIKPTTKAWATEITVLNDMLKAELAKVARNLTIEKTSREKLEQLALKRGLYEVPQSASELKTVEEKQKEIQEIALELLYQDPEFTPDIARRDEFVSALDGLIDHLPDDPQKLRDALEPYEDFLGQDLDDLYIKAASSRNGQVVQKLSKLVEQAKDKDFMWRYWVQKGEVPATLFDSFEEIISLGELQKASENVSTLPKEEKAKALLPFIGRGISAELIEQIAEGKYAFPNNFVKQQIDAFMHFFDEYEAEKNQKTPGTFKRKFLSAALAGMLATSPLAWASPEPAEQVAPIVTGLSEEDLDSLRNQPYAQDLRGEKPFTVDFDESKPVNDSPESVVEALKTIKWELEGKNLWGFYRSKAESEFGRFWKTVGEGTKESPYKYYDNGYSWRSNREYSPDDPPILSARKDISMLGTVTIGKNGTVEIPVLQGYAPTKNGIRVIGPKDLFPGLYQTVDGGYFLQFLKGGVGRSVTLSIDLGKSDVSTIPKPSDKEWGKMTEPLINIESMPDDLKAFLDDMGKNKRLLMIDAAKILEQYIQKRFTYSLNPKWSDYYHQGKNMNEFFRRIFTAKRTDCDVANTALVALLRSRGIPSRIVFGYAHTGTLGSNEKVINGAEGHGWTEAFIDGKWIQLDATPSKMDEFTKKGLGGHLSPQQLQNLSDSSPLNGLNGTEKELSPEELQALKEKEDEAIKDLEEKEALQKLILDYKDPALAVLTNAAALGAAMLLQRGNRRLALEIKQEVDRKLRMYLGTSFPKSEMELRQKAMVPYRVPAIGKDTNPLALIPPFGIGKLLIEVGNRIGLATVPYRKRQGLQKTSSPSASEFYEGALGDRRKKLPERLFSPTTNRSLKEGLSIDSYEQAEGQVWDSLWGEVRDSFEGDIAWLRNMKYVDRVRNRLSKLKPPKDPNDLVKLKDDLANELYSGYLNARRKEEAKAAKIQEEGAETKIKPPLTQAEFTVLVEKIVPYKLVLWQMRNVWFEAKRKMV